MADDQQGSIDRRRALVGGAAVGAAALAASQVGAAKPSAATVIPLLEPVEVAIPLRCLKETSTGYELPEVDLGDSPYVPYAVHVVRLSNVGGLGVMSFRCVVGTAASDVEPWPLCLAGSDFPEEYRPAMPGTDLHLGSGPRPPQVEWVGTGYVSDPARSPQQTYFRLASGWANVAGVDEPLFLWMHGPTAMTSNFHLVNAGGRVPFGGLLHATTKLVGTCVYELANVPTEE